MSWQDVINASMGRSQDPNQDVYQSAMGNSQGADGNLPIGALTSASDGQPLTSAINGAVLTSAI